MPKRPAVTKHYLPLHSFPFPTCTTDVSLPASWLDGVMVRHAGPAGGMALISSKVGGRRSRWSIGVRPREVNVASFEDPGTSEMSILGAVKYCSSDNDYVRSPPPQV
ncbi:hypothetical protein BHM03_00038954 [Ensete ventricosum]|nr:hypothetical protein BHM03_00038954 [Ensete ventricosum]